MQEESKNCGQCAGGSLKNDRGAPNGKSSDRNRKIEDVSRFFACERKRLDDFFIKKGGGG